MPITKWRSLKRLRYFHGNRWYSQISFDKFYNYFVQVALCSRKDMFIYQGFVFGFLPHAYYLQDLPPPESSRFASVVLRTFDSVSDAPVKVNTHFVRASFYLVRIKLASLRQCKSWRS